nr:exosortase F system-associated protein [Flavobacterium kayseriense]
MLVMVKAILRNKARFFVGLLLVVFLMLIRAYESVLFYDPFLSYFKSDYKEIPFPEYDWLRLFLGLFYRYSLNSVLSLGLLFLIFQKNQLIKFAAVLYLLLFVLFAFLFFLLINYYEGQSSWLLFYVRRFLIQPIFGLLFIPAFYYQKLNM